MIHTVKGFGVVNKAEIDVFLEISCFFNDPADFGNLITGSSAFSKTILHNGKIKYINERALTLLISRQMQGENRRDKVIFPNDLRELLFPS